PMLEFHGVTGSNSRSELERAVNYWTRSDIRAMVNQYKQYIILNIANEWGGSTLSDADWKNEYKESLTTLRNYSEYRDLLIVIDSNEWAQDPAPVKTYGQEILNHDAARRSAHGGPNAANVAFGIHMYGRWDSSNPSKFHVSNELATFKNTCNFPIIVGEFGYNHNNGNNNLGCTVSHTEVMSACQTRGYGYMAWSTDGNDSANSWLDMMDNWSTWTWWGLQVRDNANGIIATSVKCSLFGGGSSPITIYADALASDWANWSWNSTVDLNNSSPVKNGTKSIKVTANAGWSALSLRKGTAQSTAGKTKITFWVHGGTGSNKSIKVYASTADSGGDTTGKIITATANTWTAITVNLSEIGNPASIKRLHFQNNSSTSQPAVYFDDIKLE
ncbi:MAG TPA: hypothetical protein DCY13_00965, partial [Verrucomicrobiales bacterium]|nr:hypothetical protein [Verrucomicrobiales bacterium]